MSFKRNSVIFIGSKIFLLYSISFYLLFFFFTLTPPSGPVVNGVLFENYWASDSLFLVLFIITNVLFLFILSLHIFCRYHLKKEQCTKQIKNNKFHTFIAAVLLILIIFNIINSHWIDVHTQHYGNEHLSYFALLIEHKTNFLKWDNLIHYFLVFFLIINHISYICFIKLEPNNERNNLLKVYGFYGISMVIFALIMPFGSGKWYYVAPLFCGLVIGLLFIFLFIKLFTDKRNKTNKKKTTLIYLIVSFMFVVFFSILVGITNFEGILFSVIQNNELYNPFYRFHFLICNLFAPNVKGSLFATMLQVFAPITLFSFMPGFFIKEQKLN